MVAPRRRSTRRQEREGVQEKEPTPPPDSPSADEDPEEDPEAESEDSEPAIIEKPKKRRGRPPKSAQIAQIEPVSYDESEEGSTPAAGSPTAADSPSHMPRRRGRGRPTSSGVGRGRIRGGPSHTTVVPTDKQGNEQNVENNEIVLPEDPAGERKVDKDGNLLGGRQYRCRTFTMMNRGEQLYMLSTEPARCAGFRDSYLFFQRHKQLYKIICNEEEKFDLIKRQIIPHSYKGRAIGVCTARSVFREFGARMIVGGRKIIDDYYEQVSRDRGDVEGEIADPNDILPPPGQPYNVNQYVAWHGASSVYHNSAPPPPEVKSSGSGGLFTVSNTKRKKITSENWMSEHAANAAQFNELLSEHRRRMNDGIYEVHTNSWHYPRHMLSTAVVVEKLSDSPPNPEEFFDASVPPQSKKFHSHDNYTVEYETVAPGVTLGTTPGDMAKVIGFKDGYIPVEEYVNWECPPGLSTVPPEVYESMSEDIKKAIREQSSDESRNTKKRPHSALQDDEWERTFDSIYIKKWIDGEIETGYESDEETNDDTEMEIDTTNDTTEEWADNKLKTEKLEDDDFEIEELEDEQVQILIDLMNKAYAKEKDLEELQRERDAICQEFALAQARNVFDTEVVDDGDSDATQPMPWQERKFALRHWEWNSEIGWLWKGPNNANGGHEDDRKGDEREHEEKDEWKGDRITEVGPDGKLIWRQPMTGEEIDRGLRALGREATLWDDNGADWVVKDIVEVLVAMASLEGLTQEEADEDWQYTRNLRVYSVDWSDSPRPDTWRSPTPL
ncbi:hypothetical protein ABW19_dt0205201 [Dactylella cylindrospora]|nr:hypothetical protein ABW19_dt0205201 [Dactylella cylindrospora]